jgi:hypothetical protein
MWSPWAYPPNTGTLVTGPNLPTTPSDGSLLNTGDPWPWPEFNYQPQDGVEQTCSNTNCNIVLVAPGKSLTLWNESQTRHAEYCPNGCTYLWDFGDGQIYDGLTPPAHNYSEGIYVLTLTATDSTNLDHYCKLKLNVSVGGAKLPKWIEIPPLSARQNFLASFSQSFGF